MASIRDRATFAALRRDGVRRRSGPVTVVALLAGRESSDVRVAYAVNRAVGNAVTRNRLRRRLRAAVRTTPLQPGAYLVSASSGASTLAFDDLVAHVRAASEPTA